MPVRLVAAAAVQALIQVRPQRPVCQQALQRCICVAVVAQVGQADGWPPAAAAAVAQLQVVLVGEQNLCRHRGIFMWV